MTRWYALLTFFFTMLALLGATWLELTLSRAKSRKPPRPDDPERSRGFNTGKFLVRRADGRSGPGGKHEHCRFFVLDLEHDSYSKAALTAYARACEDDFPQLSRDVSEIVDGL